MFEIFGTYAENEQTRGKNDLDIRELGEVEVELSLRNLYLKPPLDKVFVRFLFFFCKMDWYGWGDANQRRHGQRTSWESIAEPLACLLYVNKEWFLRERKVAIEEIPHIRTACIIRKSTHFPELVDI